MSLETMAWWAGVKGLDVLACGDFTHPAWLAELRRTLRPAGDGLFALREGLAPRPAVDRLLAVRGGGDARPAEGGLALRDGMTPRPAEDGLMLREGGDARPAEDGLAVRGGGDARSAGRSPVGEGAEGLGRLEGAGGGTRFVLGTEASCVYPQGGRTRRIHVLLLAPDFAAADGLREALAPYGALESDGRPTLRLSARDLVEAALTVNPLCEAVPAHAWTPWYGVLGSKGGFDSLAEAFGDMAPHIRAVETGLSSDPAMNWRAPELDGRTLVSFSDAHSAPRLGREFTVFSGEPSYRAVVEGLRKGRVEWTGEFYPQEGKYYYDVHRKCGARVAPEDAGDGRCPACGRPMTRGRAGARGVAERAASVGAAGGRERNAARGGRKSPGIPPAYSAVGNRRRGAWARRGEQGGAGRLLSHRRARRAGVAGVGGGGRGGDCGGGRGAGRGGRDARSDGAGVH